MGESDLSSARDLGSTTPALGSPPLGMRAASRGPATLLAPEEAALRANRAGLPRARPPTLADLALVTWPAIVVSPIN